MQASTKERTKGRKTKRKKEGKKAYFHDGMTDDDFRVHINDTTKVVMTCF
jgi:hypothetical protein